MMTGRNFHRWIATFSALLACSCGGGDDAPADPGATEDAGIDAADSSPIEADGGVDAADAADAAADAGVSYYDGCKAMCQRMTDAACTNPPVGCLDGCQALVDYAPWCQTMTKGYVDCAAGAPASDWSCDGQGNAVLGNSSCQTKQQEALTCAVQGPAAGLPDLSAACAKSCKDSASLTCAASNCVSDCQKSVTDGFGKQGACKGAFAAGTRCAADRLVSSDYDCGGTDGKLRILSHACDLQAQVAVGCVAKYCQANQSDPACQMSQ